MDKIKNRLQYLRQNNWKSYGISKYRYSELKNFCLQYNEKKAKINRGIGAMNYSGMPASNYKENKLEKQAINNVAYEQDCDLIERAAVIAADTLAPFIIKSVTRDEPYEIIEYDEKLGRIPVGKTDFYALRRYFYHILDKEQLGTK